MSTQVARFDLKGDLAALSLGPWIKHRATLLGLSGWFERQGNRSALLIVAGEEAMIEAMEVSCSLGPADVMVETIARRPMADVSLKRGFELR